MLRTLTLTLACAMLAVSSGCSEPESNEPTHDTETSNDAATNPDLDTATSTDADTSADDTTTDVEPSDGSPGDTAATDAAADLAEDTTDAETGDTGGPCEAPTAHTGAPLVEVNRCGELSYGGYAAQGESEAVHRAPDFSFAGYRRGGVAIPDVPVVLTLDPEPGDDLARLQAAVATVAAMPADDEGRRGAILLRAGAWELSDTLVIDADGIVLRGEGQGADGTVITATRTAQHTVIQVDGPGDFDSTGGATAITADVPVGSVEIAVEDASGFAMGDLIAVIRTPNQTWIDALGMGPWGWTPEGYEINHERRVVAIAGNTLTVDIPIVDTIALTYGGGRVAPAEDGRVTEVGVEDLRIVSVFAGDEDEEHGWKAVALIRARDSWVRRVTAQHFGYAAVSIERTSSFNTVEEVAFIDPVSQVRGGRRYAFNVSSGLGNLFQRCWSAQARHDFVTGSRTTGPNVWLDAYSHESLADDGPHHRWSTGLLFDNVRSRDLNVENRQDSGSGHGWSGAQTLFWNSAARGLRVYAPVGAMNWMVGSSGVERAGGWTDAEPRGWWESHREPVEPRSLYLKQLEARLGADAVQAVTTPAQRSGRIWAQLAAWRGEGRLSDATVSGGDPTCASGIVSGLACCDAACGACGGDGCGDRPGGAAACCVSGVMDSARACAVDGPPCLLDPPFVPIGE